MNPHPAWMRTLLWLAGLYNLAWGTFVLLWPNTLFHWAGMTPPLYPQIWQCVGMLVGVFGVGYILAAGNPYRHWPIVLVGLLGKTFGPIGFLLNALTGGLPWIAGWVNVFNDLIWLLPFALILLGAWRHARAERLVAVQAPGRQHGLPASPRE